MMRKSGILIVIAGLLWAAPTAWAETAGKDNSHSQMNHGTMKMQQSPATSPSTDMEGMDMSGMDMDHMDMSGDMDGMSMDHTDKSGDMEGMPGMSHSGGHSHGGSEPVKETPANLPVLGTFGGIMLAFLLYGAVTKLMRRKERVSV